MNNTTPHPNPRRNPSQAVPTSRRTRTPERALRSWLHECTRKESSISTKGIAREDNPNTHPERQTPSHPHETRIKIGIDFWHAVEFSRSGRTPTRRLSATRRGNPSSLGHPFRLGQIWRSDRNWIDVPASGRHQPLRGRAFGVH